MPELPRLSGAEAIRAMEHLGFTVVRQRGSHVILRRAARGCVIPLHRSLAVGTLRSVLRQAGVTVAEFAAAIRGK